MRLGPLCPLGLGVLAAAFAPRLAHGQFAGAVDATASWVRYDGFLASGAASFSTSLRYELPRFTLGVRGTLLVFESGNQSRQLALSGAGYTALTGPVWLEGGFEGGLSSYAEFARFAHGQARAKAHLLGDGRGLWGGAWVGSVSFGDGARPAVGWEAGAWRRAGAFRLSATAAGSRVGDTAFTDLVGRARRSVGSIEVEGSVGGRLLSEGAGRGVYGDGSLTWWAGPGIAVTLSGGRYPSDPARGSVPGRYVSLAMRLSKPSRARPAGGAAVLGRAASFTDGTDGLVADASIPRFEVRRRGALAVLRVMALGAGRVEVMGDFTAWLPADMRPAGSGMFELSIALPRGYHRFNVRLNGGQWTVPAGARVSADEFGGFVGTILVP